MRIKLHRISFVPGHGRASTCLIIGQAVAAPTIGQPLKIIGDDARYPQRITTTDIAEFYSDTEFRTIAGTRYSIERAEHPAERRAETA